MNIISNNQIGTFDIPTNFIKDREKNMLLAIMGKMIIVKAECLYTPDVIRYTAFSELFEPLECFVAPVRYILRVSNKNSAGIKFEAERVK